MLSQASTFCGSDVTPPLRTLHAHLPLGEIHIRLFESDDLLCGSRQNAIRSSKGSESREDPKLTEFLLPISI